MPRSVAVLLIYAVFLTSLAVILINLIPMFIEQLEELNEHLPEMTLHAQGLMKGMNSRLIPPGVETGMNNWFYQLENRLAEGISTSLIISLRPLACCSTHSLCLFSCSIF